MGPQLRGRRKARKAVAEVAPSDGRKEPFGERAVEAKASEGRGLKPSPCACRILHRLHHAAASIGRSSMHIATILETLFGRWPVAMGAIANCVPCPVVLEALRVRPPWPLSQLKKPLWHSVAKRPTTRVRKPATPLPVPVGERQKV